MVADIAVCWPHSHFHHSRDMTLLELKAILQCVGFLASGLGCISLIVQSDCLGIVHMINSGRSDKKAYDLFLAVIFEICPAFTHIIARQTPTDRNPADQGWRVLRGNQ